jgi:hypothetical protein
MVVTPARARKLALSLEGATEAAHFDRTAFRRRTIFATLASDGSDLNLMFDPDQQEFYVEQEPAAFAPHPSAWGKKGATRCDLKRVDEATLLGALKAAYELAGPKPKKPKPKKTLTKKR